MLHFRKLPCHLGETLITGWQVALKFSPPANMSISALFSISIHCLYTKMSDPSLVLQSLIRVLTCVICVQKSQLNPDVGASFTLIGNLNRNRQVEFPVRIKLKVVWQHQLFPVSQIWDHLCMLFKCSNYPVVGVIPDFLVMAVKL